jgi:hypothetical protein
MYLFINKFLSKFARKHDACNRDLPTLAIYLPTPGCRIADKKKGFADKPFPASTIRLF